MPPLWIGSNRSMLVTAGRLLKNGQESRSAIRVKKISKSNVDHAEIDISQQHASYDLLRKISIDGDDFVVVFSDQANRRLLIEGIAARYQIRSEDVLLVEPFIFMNYLGARIICRMGGAELCFAIAKVSLLDELVRQAPVLCCLKRWIKNPVLQSVEQSLGRQPSDHAMD